MRFGPCDPSGTRASTRLAPSNGDRTLRLALVLALPTIALEQFLHTDRWTLAALPLYQALHWFSDSLLALPLAAAGVWAGQRIATRLGLGDSNPLDVVGRACLIALLFALLLVPGAALHEAADRLTHVHAGSATHSHVPLPRRSTGGPGSLARFAGHALSDAFTGQAAGLPLTILALLWGGHGGPLRGTAATKTMEA